MLASLFVAGMLVGRTAIGAGFGSRLGTRTLLACGLVLVELGVALVAISSAAPLAGLGLALSGLGTASLWPVGLALGLNHAPRAQMAASARATLASGLAVLVAPSALGLAGDRLGVLMAWPIILGIAALALVVLAIIPPVERTTP